MCVCGWQAGWCSCNRLVYVALAATRCEAAVAAQIAYVEDVIRQREAAAVEKRRQETMRRWDIVRKAVKIAHWMVKFSSDSIAVTNKVLQYVCEIERYP